MDSLIVIYGNLSIILLVMIQCIYIFIGPYIDKRFSLRMAFDYRREPNIKRNFITNLVWIICLWVVYILANEGLTKLVTYLWKKHGEVTQKNILLIDEWRMKPAGYIFFLAVIVSLYFLNSGMTEKTFYRVLMIILFVSTPVIMLIGIINMYGMNIFMPILSMIYMIIMAVIFVMFIHYWKHDDLAI